MNVNYYVIYGSAIKQFFGACVLIKSLSLIDDILVNLPDSPRTEHGLMYTKTTQKCVKKNHYFVILY